MATASVLTPFYSLRTRESNYSLHVNPLLRTRTQIHYQLIIKNELFLIKRPESNNFRVQCFMKSNKVFEEKEEKERKENSWDEIIEVILKTLNLFIQKTAIAGVILGLLMTYDPYSALAASGGRMGGRAFSSSSSESSSSSSYSSGSSSWGSSSSSSDSSPRYSSSESSSSSSSSPSYSWGSSSSSSSPSYWSSSSSSPSYWSSSSTSPSYSWGSSSSSPSYWWPQYFSPKRSSRSEESFWSFLGARKPAPGERKKASCSEKGFWSFLGARKSAPDERKKASRASEDELKTALLNTAVLKALGIIVITACVIYLVAKLRASQLRFAHEKRQSMQNFKERIRQSRESFDEQRRRQSRKTFQEQTQPKQARQSQSSVDTKNAATIIMLQVALLGATMSLQKDLDKIAEVADTSTRSGLSYILRESTVALLRHLAYCFSSYSSVDVKPDRVDGEKLFNKLTIEERAKFDEETLVNVDNVKKQSTPSKKMNGLSSDYIVMTILVAVMGEYKLCAVNNSESLKQALTNLGSILTSKILAVEVMWTPQEENDTLTELEVLKDYPRLKPLV